MRSGVIVVMGVLGGCRGEAVVREPVEPVVVADVAKAAEPVVVADVVKAAEPARTAEPVAVVEPVVDLPRTAIGAWGVEIYTPPGAQVQHEAAADRHSIHLRYHVEVGLRRVDLPAPASLAEALVVWDRDDELRKFGEGTTADGAHYALRAFQVRDGRSAGGRHVHFYVKVARVYSVIAVNATSRVECTGYVEHDVDGPKDADLAAVREVCLSLRRR